MQKDEERGEIKRRKRKWDDFSSCRNEINAEEMNAKRGRGGGIIV